MNLILYVTNDSDNTINKDLEYKYELNIKYKDNINIISPTIILNDNDVMNFMECNYCYLSDFERFYFIRTIENINNNLWGLELECDVLESFKDDIMNSYAEYERELQNGDYLDINSQTDLRKEIDIYDSDVTISGNKNIVFSTIGGAD